MADHQFPQRKKNAVDFAIPRLSAPPVQGGDRRPSMVFTVTSKGILRIDVWTSVPNDKKNGNIRADLNYVDTLLLINELESAIRAKEEYKFVIEIKDFTWSGGKRSEKALTQTKLMIGKNAKGMVYLSLLSYDSDRPKIQFFFDTPFKRELLRNGQPMSETEVSCLVARATARALEAIVPAVMDSAFIEPEPKDKNNGNNGGGNRGYSQNNNQRRDEGSGSSSSSSSSSSSDDWSDDDFGI